MMKNETLPSEKYRSVIENLSGSTSSMLEIVETIEDGLQGSEFTVEELYDEISVGITTGTLERYLDRFSQAGILKQVGEIDGVSSLYALEGYTRPTNETPLDEFLAKTEVESFLDREEISQSEIEWFAETHIKDSWHDKYSGEAIGVVSLMYLLGVKLSESENWWGDAKFEGFLSQLGYEVGDGPAGWEKMHKSLQKHGPFNRTTLDYIARVHNLTDEVDQRVILAYAEISAEAEIRDRSEWNPGPGMKKSKRICERHDTTYSRVKKFKEEFEGGDGE